MKTIVLVTAILLCVQFRSVAGGRSATRARSVAGARSAAEATNGVELRQLVKQYLPGCTLQPDTAAKPRALVSAAGEVLDLTTAGRENPEPRKGAGYWFTPTMAFLSKQRILAGTEDDAVGAIKLLHVLEHGPNFVKQKIYGAIAFDGGWVVEAGQNPTNHAEKVQALPPYELVVDASQHVVQIRERCYPYRGSARVYGDTVRSVYEREIKLNGGVNYPQEVVKELAKAWDKEKAQNTVKPAPAQKKQ